MSALSHESGVLFVGKARWSFEIGMPLENCFYLVVFFLCLNRSWNIFVTFARSFGFVLNEVLSLRREVGLNECRKRIVVGGINRSNVVDDVKESVHAIDPVFKIIVVVCGENVVLLR